MKFEIFGPDKKRKAVMEDEKCIPKDETLRDMKAAGYTFARDGKKWTPGREGRANG